MAYIGGIDLCHVGPEFGDPSPVDPVLQEQVRQFDGEMLDRAAAGDPEGWFRTAGAIGNRWRVCGLAATYTFLHAIGPAQGRLLKYEQALDDRRTCCVSFASMAFHASEPATPDASLRCPCPDCNRTTDEPTADSAAAATGARAVAAAPLPGPRRFPRRGRRATTRRPRSDAGTARATG